MLTRGKRDKNHIDIMNEFIENGCSVFDSADVGLGFPDLVVAINNNTFLVEVKTCKGRLTTLQKLFIKYWKGNIHIVKSTSEVKPIVERYMTCHSDLDCEEIG